jgi:Ca2+-binding RTX toxin-like protein
MLSGVKGVALAFACLFALAGPAQATPGEIYVSDEDTATPGPGDGGIFTFGPNGGAPTEFVTNEEFSDPTGLALYPDGRLVMVDSSANVIFFVDPASGAVTNAGGGGLLTGLTRDIAVTADRKVLAAVEDTEDVVRYDPATGAFTTFADLPTDSQLRTLVATRDGGAYVGAEPQSSLVSVIYRVSPEGIATPFVSSEQLEGILDITISADERTLLVATGNDGDHIRAVDTQTRGITPRVTGTAPVSAAPRPDGSLIYSDRALDSLFLVPPGGSTGTLFADVPEFSTVNDVVIEPERCAGRMPTVVGTTRRDVLNGSAFDDVFLTFDGNDVVRGRAGNDVVCGRAGRDSLYGGLGDDRLRGGSGRDRLKGKAGRDRLFGQAGRDHLVGGKGKDRLKGGKGKDRKRD